MEAVHRDDDRRNLLGNQTPSQFAGEGRLAAARRAGDGDKGAVVVLKPLMDAVCQQIDVPGDVLHCAESSILDVFSPE